MQVTLFSLPPCLDFCGDSHSLCSWTLGRICTLHVEKEKWNARTCAGARARTRTHTHTYTHTHIHTHTHTHTHISLNTPTHAHTHITQKREEKKKNKEKKPSCMRSTKERKNILSFTSCSVKNLNRLIKSYKDQMLFFLSCDCKRLLGIYMKSFLFQQFSMLVFSFGHNCNGLWSNTHSLFTTAMHLNQIVRAFLW